MSHFTGVALEARVVTSYHNKSCTWMHHVHCTSNGAFQEHLRVRVNHDGFIMLYVFWHNRCTCHSSKPAASSTLQPKCCRIFTTRRNFEHHMFDPVCWTSTSVYRRQRNSHRTDEAWGNRSGNGFFVLHNVVQGLLFSLSVSSTYLHTEVNKAVICHLTREHDPNHTPYEPYWVPRDLFMGVDK